jgi:hypothetical protein
LRAAPANARAIAEGLFMQPLPQWIVFRMSPKAKSEVTMRRTIIVGTSALALLAGVSLAVAQQGMNAPPSSEQNSFMQAPGQSQINLTDQQKQTIWQKLSSARSDTTPSTFEASIGTAVPKDMRLHSFARSITGQVPSMRGMDYAKLQNEVVIVDPKTRKVVDTVNGG